MYPRHSIARLADPFYVNAQIHPMIHGWITDHQHSMSMYMGRVQCTPSLLQLLFHVIALEPFVYLTHEQ